MAPNETTDDVRTFNQKIEMAEYFEEYEYEYREDPYTNCEVVYEDDDCVIVADHSGHELNEWASDFGFSRRELSQTMHTLARQKTDYSWSVADPIVFDKFVDSDQEN